MTLSTDTADKTRPNYTYQAVYRYLLDWIGALPPDVEHRLPSLRDLARRLNVSVSSTKCAYALLEDEGRVQARPKLGYFTRVSRASPHPEPLPNLLDRVFASARQPGMLALGSDAPAMLLSLEQPLLMLERELTRQYPRSQVPLYQPFGEQELRSVLAERYTRSAHDYWQAEHAFIGSDLRSLLELALRALNLEGQVALVESPCSWAVLRQLQAARMKVIEIPLQDEGRFDLAQFQQVLQDEPVRLAVLSSAVSAPHGTAMPAQDKQQVCRWLAEQGIWLFENDSYGAFGFDDAVARYRDFADPDRLLIFSTFDKLIGSEAPYGYLLCRQSTEAFQRLFLERAFRLSPIRQKAIAKLYRSGRLDSHLLRLRATLAERIQHMKDLLQRHGQGCLRVVEPQGGATLWLEATRPVDMRRVFERLLAQRIVIAPGEIFSLQGRWRSCLRLSCTVDWSQDIALALQGLVKAIQDETYTP
ncbi:PLP-dependent aminotransferase family protein [Pseudomonas vanderleydeniana]|uniref:PLP-dependent aminotransferase family protein n=1 Tax=Pseudomonas vanderleydeniana TaxID=2745495 RepID=A0A9E6PHH1_9PSED|nr:PLP-dependent aminotransferase family protein [Pseudomonas vanderleydeniana]QXI26191.1 PLP-dependent aminotransferase family protein [Pseudomonas vanderleydeniana]